MFRNYFLATMFALLALVGAEGVLRIFYEPPPTWGEPQTKHLRSPLLGWTLPPNSHSYTIDAPVAINSIGLRDDEIPRAKPPGETRVLVLGDSFTFALGLRFEDIYAQVLERRLNETHPPRRFQVINAGVAGYNTTQELIYLLSEGLSLEPDLIVVGFYWNDLVGNERELPDISTTPKTTPTQQVHETGEREHRHLIPAAIRDPMRRSLLLYRAVQAVKIVGALISPPSYEDAIVQKALLEGDQPTLARYWDATAGRLRAIADLARSQHLEVILLTFPMENQIRHDYPNLLWAEKVREIWAPTGFPMIDLEPVYRLELESGRNPFLPYDQHPNPHGMELAAKAIYDEILHRRYLGLSNSPQGG